MILVIEVLVLKVQGSAPREAGTRMWVSATETRGTIGGGNLEYTALKVAREMLLSGEAQRERKFALGDTLGQCCGGAVSVVFTRLSAFPEERRDVQFQVVLFGAGHVGKEVAHLLERLPCRLTWVDPRPEQFPAQVGANTRVVIEEEPAWMVDEAVPGAYYLIMTHSHALDLELVERILKRRDYAFVGLIGSDTKAAKFRARLKAHNIDSSDLVCPIGLFKAGKHPAEVAVSAVAQILSLVSHPEGARHALAAPTRAA